MRLEAGVAAVVVAAATLMGVGPSSAQPGDGPTEPLDVSPTSGPPGTVITVHGENCVSPVEEIVDIDLVVGDTAQASVSVEHFDVHQGAWSARLTVPAQADPDATFVVTANCSGLGPEDSHDLVFAYQPVDFDVTNPPTTTTTTPTPPPAPAPAPPAEPVPTEPTFTG